MVVRTHEIGSKTSCKVLKVMKFYVIIDFWRKGPCICFGRMWHNSVPYKRNQQDLF